MMNPGEIKAELNAKFIELSPKADAIQGWLLNQAGINLYQLARFCPITPTVVELGSWKGKSTLWLGSAIRDRGEGHVYSVDTWEGSPGESAHDELLKTYEPHQLYKEFLENMRVNGLKEFVTAIRSKTVDAARSWSSPVAKPVGLLFIDAGHKYEDVRADFESWSPFVEPGGIVVFDDVPSWPGPSRLISELPKWYHFLGASPNQWAVQKT